MAVKRSFRVYVNNEHIKRELGDPDIKFLEGPSDIKEGDLAAVICFLSGDEKNGYKDVDQVLKAIQKTNVPAIVLDAKFVPEHSRQVWLNKNTARYLPLDDAETAWSEVKRYLSERMELQTEAKNLTDHEVYPIGWSVKISPGDFKEYNLVSLFVGSMGDFMVNLKLMLDVIRPERLEENPINNAVEIPRMLEFEWARRNNKEEHEYAIKTYSKEEIKDFLENSGASRLFKEKPDSLTRNHIIIEGETGTGKSIIAEFIHNYIYQTFHHTKQGHCKRVNCANLGEKIMETQLFGSIKGAYTDAITRSGAILEAYNGTVFLDEIGDTNPELQARLLSYVETQTIQPEGWIGEPIYVPSIIVAATNKRLKDEVEKGKFRRDLHHRLGFTVTIPPMRERVGDIDRLIDFVLQNPFINPEHTKTARAVKAIEKKAVEILRDYDFPGNFRELEQILRSAVLKSLSHGVRTITEKNIQEYIEKGE